MAIKINIELTPQEVAEAAMEVDLMEVLKELSHFDRYYISKEIVSRVNLPKYKAVKELLDHLTSEYLKPVTVIDNE